MASPENEPGVKRSASFSTLDHARAQQATRLVLATPNRSDRGRNKSQHHHPCSSVGVSVAELAENGLAPVPSSVTGSVTASATGSAAGSVVELDTNPGQGYRNHDDQGVNHCIDGQGPYHNTNNKRYSQHNPHLRSESPLVNRPSVERLGAQRTTSNGSTTSVPGYKLDCRPDGLRTARYPGAPGSPQMWVATPREVSPIPIMRRGLSSNVASAATSAHTSNGVSADSSTDDLLTRLNGLSITVKPRTDVAVLGPGSVLHQDFEREHKQGQHEDEQRSGHGHHRHHLKDHDEHQHNHQKGCDGDGRHLRLPHHHQHSSMGECHIHERSKYNVAGTAPGRAHRHDQGDDGPAPLADDTYMGCLSMYAHVPTVFGAEPPLLNGAVLVRIGRRLYSFGGVLPSGAYNRRLYVFNTLTYILKAIELDGAEMFPAVTGAVGFAPTDRHIYIFGGQTADGSFPDAVHCLDVRSRRLCPVSVTVGGGRQKESVPGRVGHTIAQSDTQPDTFYMFGGRSDSGKLLDDLWRVSCRPDAIEATLTPLCNPTSLGEDVAPAARAHHAALFVNGKMVVHGGVGENNAVFDAVWTYDPASALWKRRFAFVPRSHHAYVVLYGRYMMIVGGRTLTHPAAELSGGSIEVADLWSGVYGSRFLAGDAAAIAGHLSIYHDARWFLVGGTGPDGLVSRFIRIIELPYAHLYPKGIPGGKL